MAYDLNRLAADAAHGKYGHVLADRFLLTAQIKKADGDFDVDMADVTTLGNKVMNQLPGIPKATYKFEGVSSPDLDFKLQPIKSRQSPVYFGVAPRGLSAGAQIRMFPASFGKDSDKFDEKSAGEKSFEASARGDHHVGRIMLSPKGTLLSGASGLGPIDDNSAYGGQTTFGGAAYAWLWDIATGTVPTFTPKIQHCATIGGVYTDIPGATFAAMSGNQAAGTLSAPQLIYIPSSTTILPFTQVSWATTGSPTGIQAVVGLARDFDSSL